MKIFTLILMFSCVFHTVNAQFLPFAQIDKVANTLGPAMSGFNKRHNVNFLNQSQGSFSSPLYKNFLLSYDGGKALPKNTRLGWGMDLANYNEGVLINKSIGLIINGTIPIYCKDSISQRLAIGTGFNLTKRGFIDNVDEAGWPSQFGSNEYVHFLSGEKIPDVVYSDLSLGISYILDLKKNQLVLGSTIGHINRPVIKLDKDPKTLPIRYSLYGLLKLGLKSFIISKIQCLFLKEGNAIYVQLGNTFEINPKSSKISFEIGGGWMKNEPYLNAGIRVLKKYSFNASYSKLRFAGQRNIGLNFGFSFD